MTNETKTSDFDTWFAGSKVVDHAGQPKVMYHRTDVDFDTFDPSFGDLGSHFGTSEQTNNLRDGWFAIGERTLAVYLSIKNPLRLYDDGHFSSEYVAPQLAEKGMIDAATSQRIVDMSNGSLNRSAAEEEIRSIITQAGYDGVVYENETEGVGDSWIALNSTQIKYAIGI